MHKLSLLTLVALMACNQPPEGGSVAIGPDAPSTSDDLVLDLTDATDPNKKDTVSYTIRWSANGDPQADWDDAETVPATATRRGQVWSAVVTPTDGKVTGTPFDAETTIVNAIPVITGAAFDATSVRAGDTLNASVSGTDADEDVLTWTYAWTVNGQPAGDGDSLTGLSAATRSA